MRLKLIARLRGGRDGQRGGGPGALSLYQHDMCAVETAREWEGGDASWGWGRAQVWTAKQRFMGANRLTVMQTACAQTQNSLWAKRKQKYHPLPTMAVTG